jgi:hypothetical protein
MKGKILSGKLFSAIAAIMLVALIATPVLASPATATRTLPASVASGAEFDVTIEASGCGTFGQVVETLPSGSVYVSSSLPAGQVEQQAGNMVKFTFLNDAKSFTYRVKAPTVDTTTICLFHGVVMDDDRISYPIADSEVIVYPSGDANGDANGDGIVNSLDITRVERIIAGLDTETPGADANQDGVVNSLDITKVERIIAGLD